MWDGRRPYCVEGGPAQIDNGRVCTQLTYGHFAGPGEDREDGDLVVKEPEVVSGQCDTGSVSAGQPADLLSSLDNRVGAGPDITGVVGDGLGHDPSPLEGLPGLSPTSDQ